MITHVWTGNQAVAVFLKLDRDTQGVCQFADLSKAQLTRPGTAYRMARKVSSADKLHLVVESGQLDTKRRRVPTAPVAADGVGGSPLS